jgi:ribosomal protein S12 methylthiotransferase accessory factor
MDIGIVGAGPAVDAIDAAMGDLDARVTETDAAELSGMDFGFVVGAAGADAFGTATGTVDRWVAVEVGGVGGYAVEEIDAAVSLFSEESACFRCLRQRVGATLVEPAEETQGVRSAVRYAGALAARRAIRHLTGEQLGGTVVEIEGPERRFQPVPFCRCSNGRDRTLTLTHRDASLSDAIDRAESAVDDRVGLVQQIGEQESYPLPYYLAQTADTTGFSDVRAAEFAAGADADWNRAYMKALGEALERYSAGVYRESEFRQAAAAELEGTVSPTQFVRPDDSPDPTPTAERLWAPAMDLAAGSGAWLPAEVVQYPPPEERIKPPITTGLGLGSSTVEATLSGLYEVIERDATMLAWYSAYEPLGLTIEEAADGTGEEAENHRFDRLCRRAQAEGLSVSTSLLTQDVDVPVVAVTVHRDDGEWPAFAAGSGCALDPVDAAESALAEALQNWIELRNMGPEQARTEGGAIGEYGEFPERARELTEFEATVPASSVVDDADERSGEAELTELIDRVTAAGLSPYAARLTPRDVESLGFEGVRVVVPSAQPLFTGEAFFGDRLETVASSMGFEPRPERAYHPFP